VAGPSHLLLSKEQLVAIRRAAPADAEICARICFEAFASIARQHNFALDFASAEIPTGFLPFSTNALSVAKLRSQNLDKAKSRTREEHMAGVKLLVLYPRPTDVDAFETLYLDEHLPLAAKKMTGPTNFVAWKVTFKSPTAGPSKRATSMVRRRCPPAASRSRFDRRALVS
jgi:hypothetical protein